MVELVRLFTISINETVSFKKLFLHLVRLPALIGLSRALDIILTGRPVKANEALELGLANRVVKSGTR